MARNLHSHQIAYFLRNMAQVFIQAPQFNAHPMPKAGKNGGLSVRVAQNWDELEKFRDAWEGLLAQNSEASIFLTPEWQGCWWRAFGQDRNLWGLLFLDQRQEVVAIAPFYVQQKSLFPFRFNNLRMVGAGSGDSDALDFIVKPGAETMVAETFLDWLRQQPDWGVCSLETFPKNSQVGRHLRTVLGNLGWHLISEDSIHYVIGLPATWQAYIQSLDSQFRPLLTRYPKRLQTRYNDVRIFRCENMQDLASGLETLFELHQMRWTGRGQPGAFASPERRGFYHQMAGAFMRRGWLEFWLLRLGNQTVAAQFCFRFRDTVYLLQEGFHPKYAADKIGYALRAHVLEGMIQSGAKRYDFLGGADPYKLKYGARDEGYMNLQFAGPSRLGRAYLAQRRQARHAKRWLKNLLPEPLLAALQRSSGRQAAGA